MNPGDSCYICIIYFIQPCPFITEYTQSLSENNNQLYKTITITHKLGKVPGVLSN